MSEYDECVRPNDGHDWPFWYGERPLTGFLAAAICKSRGVCIEEYGAYKKASGPKQNPEPYSGRVDLYFQYKGANQHKGAEGQVEFKVHDIGISQSRHFEHFLNEKWRETEADARKPRDRISRYGGIFLRPYIGKGRGAGDADRYEENLRRLLRTASAILQPDALAWWCPTKAVIKKDRNTENLLVGVILVLKEIATPKAKA